MADNLHWDLQISDHPTDHGKLLPILLAKDGDIGTDNIEKHRHDGAYTVEMTWS